MSASPEAATRVPEVTNVLADFATSEWLKATLRSALLRDPVDALNDALLLASVLEAHLRFMLELE
jgi:hypothetical protein